jgi:hypothetical protein
LRSFDIFGGIAQLVFGPWRLFLHPGHPWPVFRPAHNSGDEKTIKQKILPFPAHGGELTA